MLLRSVRSRRFPALLDSVGRVVAGRGRTVRGNTGAPAHAAGPDVNAVAIDLAPFASGLDSPVAIAIRHNDPRMYVAETERQAPHRRHRRHGRIHARALRCHRHRRRARFARRRVLTRRHEAVRRLRRSVELHQHRRVHDDRRHRDVTAARCSPSPTPSSRTTTAASSSSAPTTTSTSVSATAGAAATRTATGRTPTCCSARSCASTPRRR